MESETPQAKRKFSIRSALAIVSAISLLLGIAVNPQINIFPISILAWFVAWILPAASIGYDFNRSRTGATNGAIAGGLIGVFVLALLFAMLPGPQ